MKAFIPLRLVAVNRRVTNHSTMEVELTNTWLLVVWWATLVNGCQVSNGLCGKHLTVSTGNVSTICLSMNLNEAECVESITDDKCCHYVVSAFDKNPAQLIRSRHWLWRSRLSAIWLAVEAVTLQVSWDDCAPIQWKYLICIQLRLDSTGAKFLRPESQRFVGRIDWTARQKGSFMQIRFLFKKKIIIQLN